MQLMIKKALMIKLRNQQPLPQPIPILCDIALYYCPITQILVQFLRITISIAFSKQLYSI